MDDAGRPILAYEVILWWINEFATSEMKQASCQKQPSSRDLYMIYGANKTIM